MSVNAVNPGYLKENDYLLNAKGLVKSYNETDLNDSLFTQTRENDRTDYKNDPYYESDKNESDKDGKISFFDGAKSFFSGVFNKAKEQAKSIFNFVKEKPLVSAISGVAMVGAGALCATFPPVAIAAGLIGAGIGTVGLVKEGAEIYDNIKDLSKTSLTDYGKLNVLKLMGGNALEAVESGLLLGTSVATGARAIMAGRASTASFSAYEQAGFYASTQDKMALAPFLEKAENASQALTNTVIVDGVVAEGVALDKLSELM